MYVLVDPITQCKVYHPRTQKSEWHTLKSARSAATRLNKLTDPAQPYVVMDIATYQAQVPMVEVKNLMTGQMVQERADTPWHCSVASESYWSN